MNNEQAAAMERVRRVENGEPVEVVYAELLEAKGFGGLDTLAYSLCDDDRAMLARAFIAERDETNVAVETLRIINELRSGDGSSVEILCDNPEGDPNNAVLCCGDWTDWAERRYEGETLLAALKNALSALTAALAATGDGGVS